MKKYLLKKKQLLSTSDQYEITELKAELLILVKSFAKELDLPGDRRMILHNCGNIFEGI